MSTSIGGKFGLKRAATIIKYNNNGTVLIRLDERASAQDPQLFTVPLPLAWSGPKGEFIGGYPPNGASVLVSQRQGGPWSIDSYIPNRGSFSDSTLTGVLRPGRAVMQAAGGNRIFVDPTLGAVLGDNSQFVQADPKRNIFSHNFKAGMSFTEARRHIDGPTKRDLVENSTRNILDSSLDGHIYDDSLTTVALDPSSNTAVSTFGSRIRNPPFVESREVIYEFSENYKVLDSTTEFARYTDEASVSLSLEYGRRDSRADAFSLTQAFPNHLIEVIKGTGVDALGNILDLNRNALPIGKLEKLSFQKNASKADAYARISEQNRKSLAYHFEINTKNSGGIVSSPDVEVTPAVPIPDVNSIADYSRARSRFFFDVDKEGQFKFNVPASSETGNIPLLTRYENYSVLRAAEDPANDPHTLTRNSTQEVFLDSFAGKPAISLSSSDSSLDGYEAPVDRITQEPIKLGTAFHDITTICGSYLTDAPQIHLYESARITEIEPLEKIVSDEIIVSGADANAGGRSGMLNFDGMVTFNFGANTVDRQSIWIDCAGGVVSMIGRDKNNISHAVHMDGDLLIQIGGPGIGNTFDSRFADQNDAARIGAVDIRIMDDDKPVGIIRMDSSGIQAATTGRMDLTAQQGMRLQTNGILEINGERIIFYSQSKLPRELERNKVNM